MSNGWKPFFTSTIDSTDAMSIPHMQANMWAAMLWAVSVPKFWLGVRNRKILKFEKSRNFEKPEAGNRKLETGNRKPETGNREPGTGNRKTGNRKTVNRKT